MVKPEPLRAFGHAGASQRDEPASLILDLLEGRDAIRADPLEISRSKSEMTSAEFFHSIEALCFEHAISPARVAIVAMREILAASPSMDSELLAHATRCTYVSGCEG